MGRTLDGMNGEGIRADQNNIAWLTENIHSRYGIERPFVDINNLNISVPMK